MFGALTSVRAHAHHGDDAVDVEVPGRRTRMHQWSKCTLAVVLAAWVGGCASGGSTEGAATTPDVSPCLSREGSAELGAWKQVTATGFTFCVPSGWRQSDARGWRGDGGDVTWMPSSQERDRRPFVVGRVGEYPSRPSTIEQTSSVENVDGARVAVSIMRDGLTHTVRASFEDPDIALVGKAHGPAAVETLREIYRSVRIIRTP